jgi:leader peptidase (prepilin peptidase)/N-methyltransferase
LNIALPIFAFLFGASIGSFLNVVIFRMPQGISIIKPNSFCPRCKKPIPWFENIPILSYIILRGRCSRCRKRISIQYPLVEAFTAACFLWLYLRFQISWEFLFYLLMFTSLIIISGIDLSHQVIPDIISIPGMLLGVVFNAITGDLKASIIGLIFGGGLILLIRVLGGKAYKKEVMGMGDVFLTAMIGAFVGFPAIIIAIFIAALTGAIFGLAFLVSTRRNRESPIPFGPFLSIGGMAIILLHELISSLLNKLGVFSNF